VSLSSSANILNRVSGHSASRWVFGIVAFALSAWALVSQWDAVLSGVGQIGLGRTVLSAPGMLLGLTFGMLSWRTLMRAMGSRLPVVDAASMYFLGQIGKYVPGSLWPVAAQMELGKHYTIPRGRSATSILLALCVSLTSGVAVVFCALPLLDTRTAQQSIWLLAVLPVLLAILYPPLLWRVLRKVPRLGPSLELGPTPRVRDIAEASLFSVLGWLAYGMHVWVLTTGLGPEHSGWKNVLVSAGAYAFAWVAGLLFFVPPRGSGRAGPVARCRPRRRPALARRSRRGRPLTSCLRGVRRGRSGAQFGAHQTCPRTMGCVSTRCGPDGAIRRDLPD